MPVAVVGVKTRLYCSRRAKKVRPGLASRRQFVGWLQRLRDVAISVLLLPFFLVARVGSRKTRRQKSAVTGTPTCLGHRHSFQVAVVEEPSGAYQ